MKRNIAAYRPGPVYPKNFLLHRTFTQFPLLSIVILRIPRQTLVKIRRTCLTIFSFFRFHTRYAGWPVTVGISVKFGTAHGRSRPEVGSTKCIDVYGKGGVSRPSRISGKSEQNVMTPTHVLRPKHNFYSLTFCRLVQYFPNGSDMNTLLS